MADDARQAELRGLLAETLRATGVWWSEDTDGPTDRLLPIVSAWAEQDREQHAARRAAEELGEALGRSASRGPLEAVAWMARRHAALTPASEEER